MALGAIVGISHTHVSRIERGLVRNVPYATLARLAAIVGLDLPLRAFPSGEPVRDAGQLALIHRFVRSLPSGIRFRGEVPLGLPADLRAWDGVLLGAGWSLPMEAETRIRDVQALCRRIALKQRDGNAPTVLLLLADTRHNRRVVRVAAMEFGEAFPIRSRVALHELAEGRPPPRSAIVLI